MNDMKFECEELWFYFFPKFVGQELDFPLSHSLVPVCNSTELTLWKIFIRPFYILRDLEFIIYAKNLLKIHSFPPTDLSFYFLGDCCVVLISI